MGEINRLSKNLLQLLDSQVQGVNPGSLAEEIVPTISLKTNLYQSVGLTVKNDSVAIVNGTSTSQSNSATFTPPVGRTWWIRGGTCSLYAPTNITPITVRFSAAINKANITIQMPLIRSDMLISASVAVFNLDLQASDCFYFPHEDLFPMTNPDIFVFTLENVSALINPPGNMSAFYNLLYYDLPT